MEGDIRMAGRAAWQAPLRRAFGALRAVVGNPRALFWGIYVAMPVIASLQNAFLLPPRAMNNYLVFRRSFFSLVRAEDLYALHPEAHFDLYKYSPTFALAMAPFAAVPPWLGLLAWNLLNALPLFAAIQLLPVEQRKKNFVHLFGFLELLTALENEQSNALLAALVLLGFVALERGWTRRAALYVSVAGFIKIYGFAALALCWLHPRRWRTLLALGLVSAALLALPLAVTSPQRLLEQYRSWGRLLASDHAASFQLSVMGVLRSWFGWEADKVLVAVLGCGVYGLAYLRRGLFGRQEFRLQVLCSTLVFLIIFNHKAESSTYIIAVVGAALWYTLRPRGPLDQALLALTFVLTVLSPTDLFPTQLRRELVIPYALKAVPCILIWVRMQLELHFGGEPAAQPGAPEPAR